jgi:hypothetical protein
MVGYAGKWQVHAHLNAIDLIVSRNLVRPINFRCLSDTTRAIPTSISMHRLASFYAHLSVEYIVYCCFINSVLLAVGAQLLERQLRTTGEVRTGDWKVLEMIMH